MLLTLARNPQSCMDHFIDHIDISNFKSIRHLAVSGFKRINLFIGRPNVGKSNILEALSLFSIPYVWEGSRKLTDLVRLENQRELFYEGISDKGAFVNVGVQGEKEILENCYVVFNRQTGGLNVNIFVSRTHNNTLNIDDPKYRTKERE